MHSGFVVICCYLKSLYFTIQRIQNVLFELRNQLLVLLRLQLWNNENEKTIIFLQGRISQLENQLSPQTELIMRSDYHAQCEHFAKQLQEMI